MQSTLQSQQTELSKQAALIEKQDQSIRELLLCVDELRNEMKDLKLVLADVINTKTHSIPIPAAPRQEQTATSASETSIVSSSLQQHPFAPSQKKNIYKGEHNMKQQKQQHLKQQQLQQQQKKEEILEEVSPENSFLSSEEFSIQDLSIDSKRYLIDNGLIQTHATSPIKEEDTISEHDFGDGGDDKQKNEAVAEEGDDEDDDGEEDNEDDDDNNKTERSIFPEIRDVNLRLSTRTSISNLSSSSMGNTQTRDTNYNLLMLEQFQYPKNYFRQKEEDEEEDFNPVEMTLIIPKKSSNSNNNGQEK